MNSLEDIRATLGAIRSGKERPGEFHVREMGSLLTEGTDELALLRQLFSDFMYFYPDKTFLLAFCREEDDEDDWDNEYFAPNCYQASSVASLLEKIPNKLVDLQFEGIKLEGDFGRLIRSIFCSELLPSFVGCLPSRKDSQQASGSTV